MRKLLLVGGLGLVACLAFALLFRFGCRTYALSAAEVDALASGAHFADHIANPDMPLKKRLVKAFEGVPKNPRVKRHGGKSSYKRQLVQAPLPRWLGGLSISLLSDDEEPRPALEYARWGAALALAFALGLLCWAGELRRRGVGAIACAALLLLPGVADAAAAAGAEAVAAFVSALLLLTVTRAATRGRGALAVGLAWALAMAVHPGGVVLLVPIFIAIAVGARFDDPAAAETDQPPGLLRLPRVGLMLLAIPLVGLGLLVALWPTLWNETAKHFIGWVTEGFREYAPLQQVEGHEFLQPQNRPPHAWAALVQWTAWTPLPLLAAWCVGLVVTIGQRARGWWTPVLLLLTWLLIGAADGGLWGARGSLLALMWVPTAATAAVGVMACGRWLARRYQLAARWVVAGVTVAVLGAPAVQAVTGYSPRGAANGSETRLVMPLELMHIVLQIDPAPRITIVGGGDQWKHSFEVLWGQVGLRMHYRDLPRAKWIVVVDEPGVPTPGVTEQLLANLVLEAEAEAGGIAYKAYRRRK